MKAIIECQNPKCKFDMWEVPFEEPHTVATDKCPNCGEAYVITISIFRMKDYKEE